MRAFGWRSCGGPRGAKRTEDGYHAWPATTGGFVVDGPDGHELAAVRAWADVEAAVREHREKGTEDA